MRQRVMPIVFLFGAIVAISLAQAPPALSPLEGKGHTALIHSIGISPYGKTIATAGFDKTVRLWEIKDNKLVEVKSIPAHNDPVYAVAFSPDGKTLVTASLDKTMKTWTLPDAKMS